jgi:hypothetical protein
MIFPSEGGTTVSTRKAVSFALGVLAVGLVALAIGLSMSNARPDERIICDGKTMGPGDICFSNRAGHNGTYEDLVRKDRESAASSAANGPVVAVLGGIVTAVGVGVLLAQVPRTIANRDQPPPSSDWWAEP